MNSAHCGEPFLGDDQSFKIAPLLITLQTADGPLEHALLYKDEMFLYNSDGQCGKEQSASQEACFRVVQ